MATASLSAWRESARGDGLRAVSVWQEAFSAGKRRRPVRFTLAGKRTGRRYLLAATSLTDRRRLPSGYPAEAPSIAPDASQLDIGAVFHARNRVIRTLTSRELADDAAVVWADLLIDRFAHAFSRREDLEMVAGDGTANYGHVIGLLASVEASRTYTPGNGTGKSVWGGLALADFTATMAKMSETHCDGRQSWIMSSEFYYGVALPSVGGNSQGFAPDGRPMFLSHPVNIITGMPTATAVSTSARFSEIFPKPLPLETEASGGLLAINRRVPSRGI